MTRRDLRFKKLRRAAPHLAFTGGKDECAAAVCARLAGRVVVGGLEPALLGDSGESNIVQVNLG